MITWEDGDLFDCGIPAIAHGVNCQGVMGAGIALQFRQRYPEMYESYRRRCAKPSGFIPGDVMPWRHDDGRVIFNLATQFLPGPDAKLWMISAAVGRMITEAHHDFCITRIAMPEIGCGIGGITPASLTIALEPYRNAPVDLTVVRWKDRP